jgi:hypothetical protein
MRSVRDPASAAGAARIRLRAAALVLVSALQVAAPVPAHEGEEHGNELAAAAHMSEPRFEARSDAVEVTGIVKGGDIWLFVARYATNEPLAGLRISIESGGSAGVPARAVGRGIYRAKAGTLGRPGRHAVVLTLRGPGLDELLTGELVIPAGK